MIILLRSFFSFLDNDITRVRMIAMRVRTRERTTHVLSTVDEAEEGLSVRRVDDDTCFLGSEFSDKGNKSTRTSDLWTLKYNVEETNRSTVATSKDRVRHCCNSLKLSCATKHRSILQTIWRLMLVSTSYVSCLHVPKPELQRRLKLFFK